MKKNFKYLFVLILFAGTVLVWYAVFWESRDGLIVAFLDVGQGDAIFIEAENGNQILIDGGPNKNVLNQLSKVMPFYDRNIDMLIATHPDSDHIVGLVEVLKRYKSDLFMEPGLELDSAVYKELKEMVDEKEIQNVFARKGMRIKIDDGLILDILWPAVDASEMESNQASIVAKLTYGENSILLTGDIPQNIEKYLAGVYGENLKSDVLKLGHHGSNTSTAEIFLGYTSPKYAVVSVGEDNKYGHPHQEVLDLLNRFSAELFRTDQLGAIKIKSNGSDLLMVK